MAKQNRQAGIHLQSTLVLKKGASLKDPYPYEKQYYWILIAKNGKTIAKCSEIYKRKASAVNSIEVSVSILLGSKPYDLITYHDHTLEGSPIKYC